MKKKYWLFLCSIFALLLCSCANKSQNDQPSSMIPRSVLFGNPERTVVRVSHDGKNLAYLANLNGVLNIFVADIDNPQDAVAITKDTGRGIRSYFWLYDNHHIAYLKDDGGDENWRIHSVDIQTKEDKVFTPEKINARVCAVSDKFPDEIVIAMNDRDPAYHDVYRLNIRTGQKTLIFKNDQQFFDFVFDHNYNLRFAAKSTDGGGAEYYAAELLKNKKDHHFTWKSFIKISADDFYTTEILGLTHDGSILYLLDSRGRDKSVLKSICLKTNATRILAEVEKSDITSIVTDRRTGVVQACLTNYLRQEWIGIDKEFENHLNSIKQNKDGDLNIISKTLDDNIWVVAETRDNGPVGYYLYNKSSGKLTFLFNNRDNLNDYQLAKMEGVIIKARDGLELPSYLTKPLNVKGPVPLVLVVHGGPVARDEWVYDAEAQWLANRGYAVLQVNYRASTGFGKSFVNKGNCHWGRKMHEDLLDAVNWAIGKGIADPNKIAIYGLSYGGYAALWGATNSGDVFKCAVDGFGRSNLQTYFDRIPSYWTPNSEQLYRRVGDPRTKAGKSLLKEYSPLTHVAKIKIPVLIAHGEKDQRVKQVESEEIVAAMKAKNLPYIYMLFMDEGHGFARPENKFAFYAVAERFLADNLGGNFQESKDELDKSTLLQEHKDTLNKSAAVG